MTGHDRTGAAAVEVRLFGDPELLTAGRSLLTGTLGARGQIVLCRLALEPGEIVTREVLAEAVWDAEPPTSWRAALRNVVSSLRRVLGPAAAASGVSVEAHGDGYRLVLPPGSRVDLAAVADAARNADAALHGGSARVAVGVARRGLDASGRVVLPAAAGPWVERLRAEALDLHVRLAITAVDAALALGEAAEAASIARSVADRVPDRDDVVLLLVRALRAEGDLAGALTAFERFERRLQDGLWGAPSPALVALHQQLLSETGGERRAGGDGARARAAGGAPLLRLARATPFTGRKAILAELEAGLARAASAGPRVTLLVGEAGVGKTRLAAELGSRAHAQGWAVLYGRVDDRLGVPYPALVEALDGGLAALDAETVRQRLGHHAALLASMLPLLAADIDDGPAPALLQGPGPEPLLGALTAALRVIAGQAPVLLVLDDVQWASQAELALLEQLCEPQQDLPLQVVALVREGRLPQLADSPRLRRLALAGMSAGELKDLATALGRDLPVTGARRLRRLTGGNALLATELLRTGGATQGVRIGELVRRRVAEIGPEAEAVLRTAAVAGLEFDPRLVTAAAGPTPERAAEGLAEARRAGLLVPGLRNEGWLAFRHALVRSTLLTHLDPAERQRTHRRIGTTVEAQAPAAPSTLVDLAYHFAAAAPLGDWRRAVRYGLPVARAALRAGVYEDVVAVATRAVSALWAAGDPHRGARLDLEVLLGTAQCGLGDPAGPGTLRAAFDDAEQIGDAARMASAALGFSDGGAASSEAYVDDTLLELYERSLAALPEDATDLRARLLARLASAWAWRADGEASRRAREEAHALAARSEDPWLRSGVLTAVRRSLSGTLDVARQGVLDQELAALGAELDDGGLQARAALWRFETAVERGDGEHLEATLQEAAAAVRGLRMGQYHHSLAYAQAALMLIRGDLQAAETQIERAASIGLERGMEGTVVEAIRLTQLMALRFEQRRLAELRPALHAFFGAAGLPEWRSVPAFADAAVGDLETVGEGVDALLDGFDAHGVTMTCSLGMLAHVAAPTARLGDAARARRLRAIIAPHAGLGAHFAVFAGPVDFHLGLLAGAVGDDAAAQRHFDAAAAFAERLGAPRWVQRASAGAQVAA